MSEYVKIGEMVEGARCNIYTRREEWKSLQKDPITHKPMVKYELSRNCSVEITEKHKLSTPEDIELGEPVVDASTARHEGRLFYTDKRTIGVIKYPFENLRAMTQRYLPEEYKKLTDKK